MWSFGDVVLVGSGEAGRSPLLFVGSSLVNRGIGEDLGALTSLQNIFRGYRTCRRVSPSALLCRIAYRLPIRRKAPKKLCFKVAEVCPNGINSRCFVAGKRFRTGVGHKRCC